jgi:hypothetical protein
MKAFLSSANGQLSLGLILVAAVFVAFSGTVMSLVLPIWWLVTIAQGDPSEVLTICCAIFGASFILAVVVLARRG